MAGHTVVFFSELAIKHASRKTGEKLPLHPASNTGSQFGSPEKTQDVTAAAAHECSAVKYSRSAHFQSSVHLSANRPSTSATKEASTSIEGEKGQNLS